LYVTTKFLNILKDYSPYIEVFSIDEVFLEFPNNDSRFNVISLEKMGREIRQRIRIEIGEWMKVSIGISYNKLMAKLASGLQKLDGLTVIPDQQIAIEVLDKLELDEICGIGYRIKKRLNKMGVFTFKQLRNIPLELLLGEFKSYG